MFYFVLFLYVIKKKNNHQRTTGTEWTATHAPHIGFFPWHVPLGEMILFYVQFHPCHCILYFKEVGWSKILSIVRIALWGREQIGVSSCSLVFLFSSVCLTVFRQFNLHWNLTFMYFTNLIYNEIWRIITCFNYPSTLKPSEVLNVEGTYYLYYPYEEPRIYLFMTAADTTPPHACYRASCCRNATLFDFVSVKYNGDSLIFETRFFPCTRSSRDLTAKRRVKWIHVEGWALKNVSVWRCGHVLYTFLPWPFFLSLAVWRTAVYFGSDATWMDEDLFQRRGACHFFLTLFIYLFFL